MICHAIVGTNTGKEKIMKVDVVAEFIEPLVQFSEKKVSFFVMKVRFLMLSEQILDGLTQLVDTELACLAKPGS